MGPLRARLEESRDSKVRSKTAHFQAKFGSLRPLKVIDERQVRY